MFKNRYQAVSGTEDYCFITNTVPDGEVLIRFNRNFTEADIDDMMRLG